MTADGRAVQDLPPEKEELVMVDQLGHDALGGCKSEVDIAFPKWLERRDVGDHDLIFWSRFECRWCGEYVRLILDKATNTVRVEEPCQVDSVTNVFTLQVPSGKMVVADRLVNRLGDVYDYSDDILSCSEKAIAEISALMASRGVAHGYVGNTCPALYKRADGYVISNIYDAECTCGFWDKGAPSDEKCVCQKAGLEPVLANIITDLWWYSIADFDDFVSKGGVPGESNTVVEVEPGTYEFTHHTGERNFDKSGNVVIYAHIKRL